MWARLESLTYDLALRIKNPSVADGESVSPLALGAAAASWRTLRALGREVYVTPNSLRSSARQSSARTRHWRSVSRSRNVTVPSSAVWPSTVMQ